ncbi:T4S1 protein, partial [Regulus satrapa]|nr:T4S1 protein [Regulus satrapa]
MCVGQCSRVVGPCLLALGSLSVAASILLLLPGGAARYLRQGRLSRHAKAVPGLWGGGIAVSTAGLPSFPPRLPHTERGRRAAPLRRPAGAFVSVVLSKLALLGAAACFVLCGVGLTSGPLCFYNTTELGLGHGALWGYPFLEAADASILHLLPSLSLRAESYLYNQRAWSICLEPEGIVSWHVALFSLLLLISAAEMLLALLQILSGCLGCFCGSCEGK